MGSGPSRFQIKPIKIRLYYIEAAPQCQPHSIDRPAKISRFAREAFLYPNDRTAKSFSFAREAGSRSARRHMLSHFLLAVPPAEGDTRMMEQQNLSVLLAKPPVGWAESTCSHSLCPPHLLRRAHPNDGTAEPVSSAREAANRSGRRHMLSRSPLPAPPAEGIPE